MNPRYMPLTISEQTALACYARMTASPRDTPLSAWLALALFLSQTQPNSQPSSIVFPYPIEHRLYALFAE